MTDEDEPKPKVARPVVEDNEVFINPGVVWRSVRHEVVPSTMRGDRESDREENNEEGVLVSVSWFFVLSYSCRKDRLDF
jgi:hypothetical protein